MKKAGGEIKRRKRVIPASLPHHSNHANQQAETSPQRTISLDNAEQYSTPVSQLGSISPNANPLPSIRQHRHGQSQRNGDQENNHIAAPLPVDFTTYRGPSPSDNTLPPIVNFPLPESILNDRKRSYDEVVASSPDDSTTSGSGPHHRPRLAPIIDPDNVPQSVSQERHASPMIDPSLSAGAASEEKEARLEKELERISAHLAAVEAELADIRARSRNA
jgi:hypothetical protein